MVDKVDILTRWKNIEPTKKFVFWACAGTAVLTIFSGFYWGGWVTGGTAMKMADTAASEARIELAVASCVQRFGAGDMAPQRLAALKKTESWSRGGYMEKAGWVTPVGQSSPVDQAGERCAEIILNAKDAANK
jgi:hypothetical protein